MVAPGEFYDLYDRAQIDMPRLRSIDERSNHPVLDSIIKVWDYDRHFRDDDHIREARLSYYGNDWLRTFTRCSDLLENPTPAPLGWADVERFFTGEEAS